MLFEHRDREPVHRETLGSRYTCRPRTDDCDPYAVRRRLGNQIRVCFVLHDETLDVANRKGLVVVGSDARELTEVVADIAQDRRNRVVPTGHLDSSIPVSFLDRAHVLGHALVYRAFVLAGSFDTVEEPQRTGRLGSVSKK
ncbi:hypothetical protein BMS3Bbin01_00132 [bacterium BMS3Bbin01]|nr:hypothetical protein BMS3Bbin01_00132 [bacterium BMS3Bbin01]